jgi:hypothetical protein
MADVTDDRWGLMLEERERAGQVRGVARMIRGDGALIEVEMSARIFHEADGTERACVIFRDVTDRVAIDSAPEAPSAACRLVRRSLMAAPSLPR